MTATRRYWLLAVTSFSLAFLWCFNVYGFYGHITQDTTWSDTVLITGDVVIDSGVCLTIEPGTVVLFDTLSEWDADSNFAPLGLCDLIMDKGQIKAMGTSTAPVIFSSNPEPETSNGIPYVNRTWGGILIKSGTADTFEHVEIRWAVGGIGSYEGGTLEVQHCQLLHTYRGIYCKKIGKAHISHSSIKGGYDMRLDIWKKGISPSGILCDSLEGIAIIENNIIEGCIEYGINCYEVNKIILGDNTITKIWGEPRDSPDESGIGCGIYCDKIDGRAIIENNIISMIYGGPGHSFVGIGLSGGCGVGLYIGEGKGLFTVTKNQITHCYGGEGGESSESDGGGGWGIGIEAWEGIDLRENYISHCKGGSSREGGGDGVGIYYYGKGYFHEGGGGKIKENIISECEGGSEGGYGVGVFLNSSAPLMANNIISQCKGGGYNEEYEYEGEGIGVTCVGGSYPIIGGASSNQNDIFNNKDYNLINGTFHNINATHNWWGSTDPDTIAKYIFDKEDDLDRGKVFYKPWAEYPLGMSERLEDKNKRIKLSIYPNPCKGKVCIEYCGINLPAKLKIYDISGRSVKSFSITECEPQSVIIQWDGRNREGKQVPDGIYFCRIAGNKSIGIVKKIVLVR